MPPHLDVAINVRAVAANARRPLQTPKGKKAWQCFASSCVRPAMRIVITTTLNNNLLRAKLVPLLRARTDLDVVVVTDREGPQIAGVKWVWPRGPSRHLGDLGGRVLLLAREIFNPRTRLVMAYNLVPHGLFAVVLARLRLVPVFLHFIAGPAEISFAQDRRMSDNTVIRRTNYPRQWEAFARRMGLCADRIFVPGTVTRQFLIDKGYRPDRVEVLHSTIDPSRFFPGSGERDFDVVVSAQLRERKRPIFTLRVLAQLRARNPALRFCWLGDGIMRPEFEMARRELGLVDCSEWLSTDEVAPYYRRAKVFLLCSVAEGLSLACLEAMACGAVPVVTRCGDMEDVVRNGQTGCLLELDSNEGDFVACIEPLLMDARTWQERSLAGIQLVASGHSFPVAEQRWARALASG